MSIFTNTKETTTVPKCEICEWRECQKRANGQYKARCGYCADRYDSSGIAFIIYCDFYRFVPKQRTRANVKRQDAIFWVCDKRVQKAPHPFTHLLGKWRHEMEHAMKEAGYVLTDITKSDV